jgi:hypothetical protein
VDLLNARDDDEERGTDLLDVGVCSVGTRAGSQLEMKMAWRI